MSLDKCLADRVAAGAISRTQADEVKRLIADLEADYRQTLGTDQARMAAIADAAAELTRRAEKQEQQAALQIIAQARVVAEAGGHKKGWFAGVASVFARDIWGMSGHSNVEGRSRAVLGLLHGMFADGLSAFRTKTAGLSNEAVGLVRLVREIYGENTGDVTARAAATSWKDTTDYAVKRFNAAGGDMVRRDNWHLPQHWDRNKVVAAGRGGFVDYMTEAFDTGRLRIVDWRTGKKVSPERAQAIIAEAYESVSTNGLNKMVPGQTARAKLANARQERRAFEWASADGWLDFNRRFGVGDAQVLDLLTGHLDGLSRDIGMLEVLGPNPDATARLLIDTARKNGADGLKAYRLEAIWDHTTGAASSPVSETVANWGRGVRSWLTASQLGSAVLSAVSDFSFLNRTAAFNGLSTTNVMGHYTRLLNPANEADRRTAVRLGMIAEGWAMRAAGATRYQAEIVGHDLPGKIAEVAVRASGLQAHTQAGRWAFGMEFLGHLADRAGKTLDQLEPEMQRGFAAHGIGAKEWDLIRNGTKYEDGAARFIWPEALAKEGRPQMEAAARLMQFVNEEMDFAVPVPGAIERSLLVGRTRPGTFSGEFVRSTAQYKTFPVTIMTTHLMRSISQIQAGDRGRYLASVAVGTTAMGALAMQLKEISKGRDPRNINDPKFWAAAFVQGGGAGIVGDFLYSGVSRADQSFYMTAIGGPTAGLIDDVMRLTGANIAATAEGRDAKFGADLARFVRRNTPGTSLWYSRLAMDRLIWDEMQRLADPNYAASFARMEARQRKEYGQEFWWRPGASSPSRPPDMTPVR